jgi:hypothetical protein
VLQAFEPFGYFVNHQQGKMESPGGGFKIGGGTNSMTSTTWAPRNTTVAWDEKIGSGSHSHVNRPPGHYLVFIRGKTKNDWVDMMHVFANRHLSSYSATGEKTGWGYAPDYVHVDDRRLEDQKDRVFGNSLYGGVHPVCAINLPNPLVTRGIRCMIKATKHPSVSIVEMGAY